MKVRSDVKIELVKIGRTIKGLSDATGISYGRLQKCINGYSPFNPNEETVILSFFGKKKL